MTTAQQSFAVGLYLIATPIGNLGDTTQRALAALRQLPHLYAEDTRRSRQLLRHFEVDRPLSPCHEHNEAAVAETICRQIANGESCGYISDAGTPGISDPGFRLVRACRKHRLPVFSIPGANAAIAALSISGLPTDRFRFLGFLPPKRAARLRTFSEFQSDPDTLIFYESTHRIEIFLEDALSVFGTNRFICIARELTKLHETILTGPLGEVCGTFAQQSSKGEFVVMIAKEGYQL